MNRICQGWGGLFGLLLAFRLAAVDAPGPKPAPQPVTNAVSVSVEWWIPRPFPDVILERPNLGACVLAAPAWVSSSGQTTEPADPQLVATAVTAHLRGVLDGGQMPALTVVLVHGEEGTVAVVARQDTALALVPGDRIVSAEEIARAVAPVVVQSTMRPAPRDPRCSELLLSVGEALANAGSLALAALPAELRPVGDWLDVRDAAAPLDAFASAVFDTDTTWKSRKALLASLTQTSVASPQLAHSAALLVEALGDAGKVRSRPYDLLLAWRENTGKKLPAMPRDLKHAMAKPLEAGMPRPKHEEDAASAAAAVLQRRLASEAVLPATLGREVPLADRLTAAAATRARGDGNVCDGLVDAAVRPGCRGDNEEPGMVFTRAVLGGGFEVIWRSLRGAEGPILRWPSWVLFPAIDQASGELLFIDPQGVWRLPLDGRAAPQILLAGSYRYLSLEPGGHALATVRWPAGDVEVVRGGKPTVLPVKGRGGVAWLDAELLAASDSEKLSLVTIQGQLRPNIMPLPCSRGIAALRGALVAAMSPPCEAGITRLQLADRKSEVLLKLSAGALGVVALADGSVAGGGAGGVVRWRADLEPERPGAGFTPGPG
jgi:hypothetical protein